MENQVTSIQQSKLLIELGVPADKASMVWEWGWVCGTVDEENYELKIWQECKLDKILAYQEFPESFIPAFTVADLLAVLPKVMEDDEGVPFYLNIQYNRKEYSEIKYKGVYGILWSCFGASLLNNLVEAVDGVVTNGYELTL